MKKIIILACLIASVAFARTVQGDRVIVKKDGVVVYKTGCGETKIINPLNVQRGGGVLSGGADVEVLQTITVTYTNKVCAGSIFDWVYLEKPRLVETVKNFPMNDYSLDFIKEGCSATAFE